MPALAGQIANPDTYNTDTRRLIAHGRRTTNKTGITTEVEILRLDGVPVKSGHLIKMEVSNIRLTNVATEVIARLRVSSSGTATVASTGIRANTFEAIAAGNGSYPAWFAIYLPSADESLSIVLTLLAGSSISMMGADTDIPLELLVWDMGTDTGDIGITL